METINTPSNLPSVAVVILSWNGKSFLEQFLPSVVKSTYPNCKIYVADNASTDDSVPYVHDHYPDVEVLELGGNLGYAGGYNEALKRIESDYFVLLNQDVEVPENWIEPVIELMESDRSVAACQPKIKQFQNRNMFEYAGAAGGWIDRYGLPFCQGRIFDDYERDIGQYDQPCEIFWASGAALFVRSQVYHETGGLDEDFFAHMEEIDLCWRMKLAGFKVMNCPSSEVYHVGGGSLPKGNPKKVYLNFRNNLIILAKNLPADRLYKKLLLRMILDQVASFRGLTHGLPKDWLAVQKAHLHFLQSWKTCLQKRTEIQRKVNNPNYSGVYHRSIVWDHFVLGKKRFSDLKPK